MLRAWDIPEQDLNPPADILMDCDECGATIWPYSDYAEVRSLYPRRLCKACADDLGRMQEDMAEDDRELIAWFVA